MNFTNADYDLISGKNLTQTYMSKRLDYNALELASRLQNREALGVGETGKALAVAARHREQREKFKHHIIKNIKNARASPVKASSTHSPLISQDKRAVSVSGVADYSSQSLMGAKIRARNDFSIDKYYSDVLKKQQELGGKQLQSRREMVRQEYLQKD
mmetsp:Transcript_26293/g.19736  ORF Transcript_26293/g.19736 Transcript_26293/m.19736 type:complete len:158 (-) Transcript_26293:189-662(-)|eukprot:CAMPEP_0202979626 /NCGR_PEP_ID=MMETSP1396-20130829/85721_1 /ASSEMBLY_ACC=CAM_ASM_000872 /TAXON_ID= /ORGANISM="Pseudokeronopsis sp., Strain Brazil" /LENGTH=157 /DNA_ID=CAMNT_0049719129 /DNA_START=519 /DNA_END=992 /DNA_ORIENTATION=+